MSSCNACFCDCNSCRQEREDGARRRREQEEFERKERELSLAFMKAFIRLEKAKPVSSIGPYAKIKEHVLATEEYEKAKQAVINEYLRK